jgi:tetratricopeptide (TPR) repeat protein
MAAGDEALREADWPAAWSAYESARQIDESECPADLHYRLGLSAELLDEFELAQSEYQAASSSTAGLPLRVAALLGEARSLQQLAKPEEARRVLSALWLTSLRLDQLPLLAHHARYALAELQSLECLKRSDAPPWSDDGILSPSISPELAIRWLELSRAVSTSAEQPEAPPGVHVVQQNLAEPDGIEVQVRLNRTTLEEAVEALCRAGGFQVRWTPAARQGAVGRTVEVGVRQASVAVCLDVLTADHDLSWTCVGSEIQLAHGNEVAASERIARERRAAARAALQAILRHTDPILTPRARLWLGNLAAIDQHPADAAAHYEQLLAQFPRAGVRIEAWFNLAKARLELDDRKAALEAFNRVVDFGQEDAAAATASIYAGRLLLESGEPRRAADLYQRATRIAADRELRALSALGLSAAHLMAGNPAGADLVLMEHREHLVDSKFHDVAAFLGAAARVKAAREPGLRAREGRNLLFAVTRVSPTSFFGSHGWYLIGRAYADLGLAERAAEVFEEGLQQIPRPAGADAMLLDLAQLHLDCGRTQQAEILLTTAAGQSDPQAAIAARIQICELAARDGDAAQVLDRCRNLLSECSESRDRLRVLRVMGQTYQQAGDYSAAAMCFAGTDPATSLPEFQAAD